MLSINITGIYKTSMSPIDPEKTYTLKERFFIRVLSSFTLVFVVMLFGPVNIFSNNVNEMPFRLADFATALFAYAIAVFLFFAVYLPLFKTTIINIMSALLLILPVASAVAFSCSSSVQQAS